MKDFLTKIKDTYLNSMANINIFALWVLATYIMWNNLFVAFPTLVAIIAFSVYNFEVVDSWGEKVADKISDAVTYFNSETLGEHLGYMLSIAISVMLAVILADSMLTNNIAGFLMVLSLGTFIFSVIVIKGTDIVTLDMSWRTLWLLLTTIFIGVLATTTYNDNNFTMWLGTSIALLLEYSKIDKSDLDKELYDLNEKIDNLKKQYNDE